MTMCRFTILVLLVTVQLNLVALAKEAKVIEESEAKAEEVVERAITAVHWQASTNEALTQAEYWIERMKGVELTVQRYVQKCQDVKKLLVEMSEKRGDSEPFFDKTVNSVEDVKEAVVSEQNASKIKDTKKKEKELAAARKEAEHFRDQAWDNVNEIRSKFVESEEISYEAIKQAQSCGTKADKRDPKQHQLSIEFFGTAPEGYSYGDVDLLTRNTSVSTVLARESEDSVLFSLHAWPRGMDVIGVIDQLELKQFGKKGGSFTLARGDSRNGFLRSRLADEELGFWVDSGMVSVEVLERLAFITIKDLKLKIKKEHIDGKVTELGQVTIKGPIEFIGEAPHS